MSLYLRLSAFVVSVLCVIALLIGGIDALVLERFSDVSQRVLLDGQSKWGHFVDCVSEVLILEALIVATALVIGGIGYATIGKIIKHSSK